MAERPVRCFRIEASEMDDRRRSESPSHSPHFEGCVHVVERGMARHRVKAGPEGLMGTALLGGGTRK